MKTESKSNAQITRRGFVCGLGMFSLSLYAAKHDIAPRDDFKGVVKGRKIKLAAIGSGGMGGAAAQSLISSGCELVAVCDINPKAFDRWEKAYPGIPKFIDYREMLKVMGDKFEAVEVGTPDHTHAYISIDCMNAGKHVYVQKPLARTFEECEMMLAASIRNGVVVQMGNQGHPGAWRYAALRDAAVWGEIKEIYSWSDRPIWPQGMKEFPKVIPLPKELSTQSWDCWCGPSADHGYGRGYHPFAWRGWWDYGCGAIGDMAVHNADPAFWAFELGLPISVKADTFGEGPVTIAYPKKSRIEMTFAPNKWVPNGIKLVWTDGNVLPDENKIAGLKAYAADYAVIAEKRKEEKAKKAGKPYVAPTELKPVIPDNGLIIVGTKATTIGGSHASTPTAIVGDKNLVTKTLKSVPQRWKYNHYREFVEACLEKNPAKCGSRLAYAAPLTEALLIGCIALRFPGQELKFDPKAKKFTNNDAANAFLKAPKRNDWDFKKLCK